MSDEANITPQSGRRPRLGLGKRGCQSTPLLRIKREDSAVHTPNENLETPRALALSLSSRRIGLSKNRSELTKKKLEFAAVHDTKDEEPKVTKKPAKKGKKKRDSKGGSNENKGVQDLTENNNPQKNELEEDPQCSKIIELQGDIEIWRKAFIASVDDLLTLAEPGLSKKDLLYQLGIPSEMLRYLEEE
ncbi:uncharacterized protein LOC108111393 [Drosophila eugracilis]|uniref:uncharacterized protein LOC108111393 n=1 Tax=Drosophila eugracilis TaxID=29029 RepID=UPI0007E6EAAB|nr:uncharacterized protein LOC108111393 [Drosophila eugracilis]